MDIKRFKPSKNSRYSQGYIDPKSCKKLFESQRNQPIIYRSSWEKRFMCWCESSSKVKSWGSECAGIPYVSALDHKEHMYYPDFYLILVDGTKVIVEIKPHHQTIKPNPSNVWATKEYLKNMSKWMTVKSICQQKNWLFWIITEKTIEKL